MFHSLGIILLVVSSSCAFFYCPQKDDTDIAYRVPKHSCACNAVTAGTLRYFNGEIQFCDGKKYVHVAGEQAKIEHKVGSKERPASSCKHVYDADKESKSGEYYVKLQNKVQKVYCVMDNICGSRGWTMIMKIDGRKTTFTYKSSYWNNKAIFNPAGASSGLGEQETKLQTYSDLAFNALCLGMKTGNTRRWLRVPQKASSLYSLIADNRYRSTRLGRNAWKTLIPGSSLQRNCNKEGFNVYNHDHAMARIGIISNQENNCASPDSRIGFGTAGHYCGQDKNNSAGNEARCSADNGNKSIKSFGYILAQ